MKARMSISLLETYFSADSCCCVFYAIVYLDMIGHKNSHLASVTFQVLALAETKVPLVWDMCDAAQSVQIANPRHVSQVFRMS